MTTEELITKFSMVSGVSYDRAKELVGAETTEEILNNIRNFNLEKIRASMPELNRKQRRALAKKTGKHFQKNAVNRVTDTATKLNYINLIEKLRALNAEKEQELNEDSYEIN